MILHTARRPFVMRQCPGCCRALQQSGYQTWSTRITCAASQAGFQRFEAEEVQGAELISLEEADAEAQGKQAEAAEDVEANEAIEDDAEGPIIEQEEEEDTDVSEIIGGDIEDAEET